MELERLPGLRQLPGRLPVGRRTPLVLFGSWRGAYADHPRAISEVLRRRRPDLPQVWAVDDASTAELPEDVRRVAPGSAGHLAALARASHVVSSVELPNYWRKPAGARYLQTWHGTPLKRIGFDIPRVTFAEPERFRTRLEREVSRWDALLSPSPFASAVFRRAFRYDGTILEVGSPRDDLLLAPEASAGRRAVRARLGLDDSTRAVLYAPTWRDSPRLELALDLAALRGALGDGWRMLLRAHPLARAEIPPAARGGTLDVSAHPDMRELLLAADVLVTDYSSAMFDFALTGRPMLFFTYDLADYRDRVRGFCFDFAAAAPGPLLESTAAVAHALSDLDAVARRHAGAYAAFVARFCPLDDGHAAERAVAAFFGDP